MSTNKLDRKELKKMDSFQVRVLAVIEKFFSDRKTVYMFSAAIVLILGVVVGANLFFQKRNQKLSEGLAAIDIQYEKEQRKATLDLEERAEQLQNEMQKLSQNQDPTKSLGLQQEMMKLQEEFSKRKPDHSESMAAYWAFYEKHTKQKEGWVAGLQAIAILLDQSKLEDAQAKLENLQKNSQGHLFYETQINELLANLYEQQKKHDLAIEKGAKLVNSNIDSFKQTGLLVLARNYIAKGEKDKAADALDKIIKDHKDSPIVEAAKGLKALL